MSAVAAPSRSARPTGANGANGAADANGVTDANGANGANGAVWYRMPVFWLAVLLFVASLAGCIITIMIALGQPGDALADGGERIFKVPTTHSTEVPE